MKTLTFKQLYNDISSNRFIALRDTKNRLIGVNCAISSIDKIKKQKDKKGLSLFYSFYPISFMEYISLKIPFLK